MKVFIISNVIGFILILITPLKFNIERSNIRNELKIIIGIVPIKISLASLEAKVMNAEFKFSFIEAYYQAKGFIMGRELLKRLIAQIKLKKVETLYIVPIDFNDINELSRYMLICSNLKKYIKNYNYYYQLGSKRSLYYQIIFKIRIANLLSIILLHMKDLFSILKGFKNGKRRKLYKGKPIQYKGFN